jgi:alpha-D-xyloside xylohydrolase
MTGNRWHEQPFEVSGSAITWKGAGETVVVQAWGANSVRVRATRQGDVLDSDWALLPPVPSEVKTEAHGDTARLHNGGIIAELRAVDQFDFQAAYQDFRCQLAFYNADGTPLLEETDPGGALKLNARHFRPRPGGDGQLTASFAGDPDERLYGMGQYQQRIMNLKGSTFELAHRNSQVSIPFVLSSRGYGFLWHNPAIGRATFASNRTEWFADSTRQLDYWVTAGDTPAQILTAYADATGHAPMMPEYGLGFWQCKLRYWNQEQLLEVAREYKRRGIPIDVIVADFFHWPKMGDYRFEAEFWPDPTAMVDELRQLGIELMVSVWPQVSVESENFAEMRKNNFLVSVNRGPEVQMSFEGPSVFFDPTNPAAREYLWKKIDQNYGSHGIRLFWLDEAEPEFAVYDFDNYRYHAGPVAQVGNIYPQQFARAFYDRHAPHDRPAPGEEQVVSLVRAAWAGSQRYGALVWSGDIHSTWTDLARQITAGIHMGIAGIPWFTTDIGGFAGGDIADPKFHELLVRWFQFGAFSPVMRLHGDHRPGSGVTAADGSPRLGTGAGNEIWSFGEPVYQILRRYIELRERLRPYIRDTMRAAHVSGHPVMRALFLEFPGDPRAWEISDQYLFGPDLLVAPVIEPDATSRNVYLPSGTAWTDFWTGQAFDGGQEVTVAAPLDAIPVFVREPAASGWRPQAHQDRVEGLRGQR